MNQNATAMAQPDTARGHPHAEQRDPDHGHEDHEHPLARADLVRIGLVAAAVVASWFGLWKPLAGLLGLGEAVARFDVIALVATLAGGYPIFQEAVANLVARRMTMELSMTIALAAALAFSDVGWWSGSTTWKRMWPSMTSAIRLLMAPRQAAMVSRMVEQSCSCSSAFSTAAIWPRMRRTRLSSFFLSRMVWATGSGSGRGHRTSSLYNTPVGYMQGPCSKHEV